MFETARVILTLKKLTNNASNIPLDIIKDVSTKVVSNYYSVEQGATMILVVSLNLGYIDRDMLTERGERLVLESEKFDKEYGGDKDI